MDDGSLRAEEIVRDQTGLRSRYPEPSGLVQNKILHRIDRHARAFIGLSPFLVIATAGVDGSADASPAATRPASSRWPTRPRC